MGCGSSSNADAVKAAPKAIPFSERLGKIEFDGDPEQCIADMRLLRRKRELKPRGFIARVIFKGSPPEDTPPSEDEDLPGNKGNRSKAQSTNGRSDDKSQAEDTRRSGDEGDNLSKSQRSEPGSKKDIKQKKR